MSDDTNAAPPLPISLDSVSVLLRWQNEQNAKRAADALATDAHIAGHLIEWFQTLVDRISVLERQVHDLEQLGPYDDQNRTT